MAESLLGPMEFYELGSVDPSKTTLEDLILVNERFDRLLEVLKLFDRANDKAKGLSKARLTEQSPLRVLKFVKNSELVKKEIVHQHTNKWYHDTSDQRFIEDLDFLLKSEFSKKVRVQYL